MAKQIIYEELKAYVEEGKKKADLAEIYELPMTQVTKLLQQAGLKIRKFHAPKFELVMPTEGQTNTEESNPIQVPVQSSEEITQEIEDIFGPVVPQTDAVDTRPVDLDVQEEAMGEMNSSNIADTEVEVTPTEEAPWEGTGW